MPLKAITLAVFAVVLSSTGTAAQAPQAKTESRPLSKEALAGIERMTPIFDGRTLDGWVQLPADSWTVKDGAMSSLGAGRGVIYSQKEYKNFRLILTMRHLGGPPKDHRACILIFCTAPAPREKALDALGGIQLQSPLGGSWDYRPRKNNSGRGLFTRLQRPAFDEHEWHRVEILVNADKGTARMAVAQPVETRAIEVLRFEDPSAGKTGPIAWQMHNAGLFDEYKDVRVEVDPGEDKLLTLE